MTFEEKFSIKNGFTEPKTFKEMYKNYDEKHKAGNGIYVIFKNKNFTYSIKSYISTHKEIKIDYKIANEKLSKSDILLIGLPQMMYSTKYDLENEIYQLYKTGQRFPKRTFFGKLLFILENYETLNVSYKKLDFVPARYEYLKLINEHVDYFDTLPFANLSNRAPKLPYPYK